MDERRCSRREYALAVGTAAGVGLAGCSNTFEQDGGQLREEFPSLVTDDPTHRGLVPPEQEDRFDLATHIEQIRNKQDRLPAGFYEWYAARANTPNRGYVGVDYEEIQTVMGHSIAGYAIQTPVTASTVRSRLEQTPYEQFTERDEISYHRDNREEPAELLAVSDKGLFAGPAEYPDKEPNQWFIDESKRILDADRQSQHSDLYTKYTEQMGLGLIMHMDVADANEWGVSPPFLDLSTEEIETTQLGFGTYLGDGELVDRYWIRVTDEDVIGVRELKERCVAAAQEEELDEDDEIAVRSDGQLVEVAVIEPIEDPGGGTDPPITTLDVSVTDGTATIENLVGDSISLDRVIVEKTPSEEIPAGSETLDPGEQVRVDVGDADDVRLLYDPPNFEKWNLAES